MKRSIGFWQLIGFFAVSVLGVFLHFLYGLTDSIVAALFSAVNESTWEHMKLLFFPMLMFAITEYFYIGKEYKGFWCIKLKGALLGLLLIPVMFYTVRGIFGTTPDWVNIAIFFISVAVAFIYETRKFKANTIPCKYEKTAVIGFCIITATFMIFTFTPPQIPLFMNPIDDSFGI